MALPFVKIFDVISDAVLYSMFTEKLLVRNEQIGWLVSWLGYIRDEILHSYMGIFFINHYKDPN